MATSLFITIGIMSLLGLNVYAIFLWHWNIRPLVKKYCGGKSHSFGMSIIAMLQDYFLAQKIIRNEKLGSIWQIAFFGLVNLLNVIVFLALAGTYYLTK